MVWRLLNVLPGWRKAGRVWDEHLERVLTQRRGFARLVVAPQQCWNSSAHIALEKHVDDRHIVGEPAALGQVLSALGSDEVLEHTG